MIQKIRSLASIRLVRRKSTPLTTIVVSAAIVLSMAALLTLHGAIDAAHQRTEVLRQQAILLEQEHQRLEQHRDQQGSMQEIVRIAQERLGLIYPDSIVFQPE